MNQPLLTLANATQHCPKVIVQAFKAPYREAVDIYGRRYVGPHRLIVRHEEADRTHTCEPISEDEFQKTYRRIGDSDSEFYDVSLPPALIAPLAQFPSVELDIEPIVHFQFTNNYPFVYLGNHRLQINLDHNQQTPPRKIRTANVCCAWRGKRALLFNVWEDGAGIIFSQAANDSVAVLRSVFTGNFTRPYTASWQLTIKAGEQTSPNEEKFVLQQPDGQLSIIDRFRINRTYVPLII